MDVIKGQLEEKLEKNQLQLEEKMAKNQTLIEEKLEKHQKQQNEMFSMLVEMINKLSKKKRMQPSASRDRILDEGEVDSVGVEVEKVKVAKIGGGSHKEMLRELDGHDRPMRSVRKTSEVKIPSFWSNHHRKKKAFRKSKRRHHSGCEQRTRQRCELWEL